MSRSNTVRMPDGQMVRAITLTHEDGRWMGNVIMEWDDAARWGRLYTITDYGDYGYCWNAVGKAGFDRLLRNASVDYLLRKLVSDHDEASVVDVDATATTLRETILERAGRVEADYLGEALNLLARCEFERDLWDWQARHSDLAEYEDMAEAIHRGPGRWTDGYRKYVIPALQKHLAGVLAA